VRGKRDSREYRRIYSENYGAIPAGYHIHHKDNDHQNNCPSNLVAVTPEEHVRLHIEAGTMYRGADPTAWISGASEAGKKGGAVLWADVSAEDRSRIMKERGKNSPRNAGKKSSTEKKKKIRESFLNKPMWTCDGCGKVMRELQGNIKQHKKVCRHV
jgi:hypothetical protein